MKKETTNDGWVGDKMNSLVRFLKRVSGVLVLPIYIPICMLVFTLDITSDATENWNIDKLVGWWLELMEI